MSFDLIPPSSQPFSLASFASSLPPITSFCCLLSSSLRPLTRPSFLYSFIPLFLPSFLLPSPLRLPSFLPLPLSIFLPLSPNASLSVYFPIPLPSSLSLLPPLPSSSLASFQPLSSPMAIERSGMCVRVCVRVCLSVWYVHYKFFFKGFCLFIICSSMHACLRLLILQIWAQECVLFIYVANMCIQVRSRFYIHVSQSWSCFAGGVHVTVLLIQQNASPSRVFRLRVALRPRAQLPSCSAQPQTPLFRAPLWLRIAS